MYKIKSGGKDEDKGEDPNLVSNIDWLWLLRPQRNIQTISLPRIGTSKNLNKPAQLYRPAHQLPRFLPTQTKLHSHPEATDPKPRGRPGGPGGHP